MCVLGVMEVGERVGVAAGSWLPSEVCVLFSVEWVVWSALEWGRSRSGAGRCHLERGDIAPHQLLTEAAARSSPAPEAPATVLN